MHNVAINVMQNLLLVSSANVTNGVTAMLKTAPDGKLLGIRVEWSIKSEYSLCQFTTLRVELNNNEVGKDISVTDGIADFPGDHLQCNRQYTPRVMAVISAASKIDIGASLFYVGKTLTKHKLNIHACLNCVSISLF